MKLNQIPNFRAEDYPSEQSWISRLFVSLNPFIQSVNQVFDQNVDYSTNIKTVTKSYDILTFQPFSFQWAYSDATPVELTIVKALKGSQLTPTVLFAAWAYDPSTLTISVSRMAEITSTPAIAALSGRYQFTIRVSV